MKTSRILTIPFTSMVATTIASPDALPMGVKVFERDGETIPNALRARGLDPRCWKCVDQCGKCTINHGSCYAEDPPLKCTALGVVTTADLDASARVTLARRPV
ncbi:unnamed protein product, partial [Fusarium equiseti]